MHKNISCSSFSPTKTEKEKNSYDELVHKKNAIDRIAVKKKKLHGHFLWMGFNCLKAAESLLGDSLSFTTKYQAFLAHILSTSNR